MTTTIISKDVGEVKDKFYGSYKWQLEDGVEDRIKMEMGVEDGL